MNIAILAGGPEASVPDHATFYRNDIQWVGVDRGTYHLLKKGLKPIRAFGDFDSISKEEKVWLTSQEVVMSSFPAEKDQTDLELAINWAIEQEPDSISIFGATGGRLDHSLMNVQLLIKGLGSPIDICLIDKQNIIFMKTPGTYQIEYDPEYQYLSFLAFTQKVRQLSITGVKYPLKDATLVFGDSLCISNEIIQNEASYSFNEGTILVIRSHD